MTVDEMSKDSVLLNNTFFSILFKIENVVYWNGF